MKTFALSLLAVVASARYYGAPQSYGSSYSPYRQTSSKYSPRPAYGAHYPTPPVTESYYPKYPTFEKHEPKEEEEEEAEPEQFNPWATEEAAAEDEDAVDTTGWYSPTMQYSPPKIAFKPTATYPVFGICEINTASSITGTLQLAQLPGKATLYQVNLSAATPLSTIQVQIKENGKVGSGEGLPDCADATGSEFNPLSEIDKYGNLNPFQDPSRGRIADLVGDETSEITVAPTFVLQNLTGKDGILGRAITLLDMANAVAACCVIAVDETPDKFKPAPAFPSQKYGGHYGH